MFFSCGCTPCRFKAHGNKVVHHRQGTPCKSKDCKEEEDAALADEPVQAVAPEDAVVSEQNTKEVSKLLDEMW